MSERSLKDVKLGDEVVVSRHGCAVFIAKVSRIMKRYFELHNGTRWGYTGRPYPDIRGWGSSRVDYATDADRLEYRRARVIGILSNVVWKNLSDEKLFFVFDAYRKTEDS